MRGRPINFGRIHKRCSQKKRPDLGLLGGALFTLYKMDYVKQLVYKIAISISMEKYITKLQIY
jgi:hypothetical protein